MNLAHLAQQLLDGHFNTESGSLKDHGITTPDQFSVLCLYLAEKGITIHPSELNADVPLSDLQMQVEKYQFGNKWKASLQPEAVLMPYAGLAHRFG